ncbi:hypothetical protein [Streptomyces sp. NPDC056480]
MDPAWALPGDGISPFGSSWDEAAEPSLLAVHGDHTLLGPVVPLPPRSS